MKKFFERIKQFVERNKHGIRIGVAFAILMSCSFAFVSMFASQVKTIEQANLEPSYKSRPQFLFSGIKGPSILDTVQ
jgi:hypothetical protein